MMKKPAPDTGTWIVIPAFNEEPVIGRVLKDLHRTGHRLLVVDDASSDATAAIAESLRATVLKHPINLGQGAALQSGIAFALAQGADIIVTFDADGQHKTEDIAHLIAALAAHDADFALGSRFLGRAIDIPASRRILLWLAARLARLTTGMTLTDAHNGLRAMTRRGARHIHLRQNRMAHASEILDQIAASGLRYVEVPVTIEYSHYSRAKGQRSSEAVNILVDFYARKLHQ